MSDGSSNGGGSGKTFQIGPLDGSAFGRFVGQVGVPAALAFVVLLEVIPRIDHGIAVADHVDAELQFLAARGCAPLPLATASSETLTR